MKKTFEESLAAMEQRTIEGEKRTLKREEEQRKASQLELAILTDRLNEAVVSTTGFSCHSGGLNVTEIVGINWSAAEKTSLRHTICCNQVD